MAKRKKIITALSLQGGGALGAYECGALKALYEQRGPNFRPRIVAGISIGAINAALLVSAKEKPIETLETVWRERFTINGAAKLFMSLFASAAEHPLFSGMNLLEQNFSLLGNPGMYRLRPEFMISPFLAPFHATSLYDTSLLKRTLEEFADVEKLNRPDETRVIVTAINVATGEQARFDNAKMILSFDHILASGSFPVSFPMMPIRDNHYWDGVVFINTPLGPAVNALEEIERDNPHVIREIISMILHRSGGKLPATLQEAAERFYNLVFSEKIHLDRKLFNKVASFVDLVQEIDRTLPADSPIRQHRGYKELIRHRKIDRAITIGDEGAGAFGSTSDFSRKSIGLRIENGYNDAIEVFKKMEQNI
jgi:NTE family protein